MKKINDFLFNKYKTLCEGKYITNITFGLGYTFVEIDNKNCGISYTYFEEKNGCTMTGNVDIEGKEASFLLNYINSDNTILKSGAVALINAINQENSEKLLNQQEQWDILSENNMSKYQNYAMIGFFGPIFKTLKDNGKNIKYIDDGKNLGNKEEFYNYLKTEAQVVVITSTSILNNSFDSLLKKCQNTQIKLLLGPSTILDPDLASEFNIQVLAGSIVKDKKNVLKSIRNGFGTPGIKKYLKKTNLAFFLKDTKRK